MSFNLRSLWMHHNQQVDARLDRPIRSHQELIHQIKQHSSASFKPRLPPVPPAINLGRLTEYEMFDILEHFFTVTSHGADISIQWTLLDMQGRIPV